MYETKKLIFFLCLDEQMRILNNNDRKNFFELHVDFCESDAYTKKIKSKLFCSPELGNINNKEIKKKGRCQKKEIMNEALHFKGKKENI